jgi:uncharacterized protein (DUF2164 family)
MLIQKLLVSGTDEQMKKLVSKIQTYLTKDLETCSKELDRE